MAITHITIVSILGSWRNSMDIELSKIITPAIVGLLSGALGSLLAPWIHWGIEKRREDRKKKQDLINLWRRYIARSFKWDIFRDTVTFSQMKPYLSDNIIKELDPTEEGESPTVHMRSVIGEDTLKKRLLDEITAIEKQWELI